MGCGSSGNVVPAHEDQEDLDKVPNGKSLHNGHDGHNDDLPTVMLPDTPVKPKPPIAFEIPLEEFGTSKPVPTTPPPHLQRLLQPPQADISLPDIEEKLAEAEQRRHSILQQRAASAQKRAQKMMRSVHEMDILDSELESMDNKFNMKDINIARVNAPIMDSYKQNNMMDNNMRGITSPIMDNKHNIMDNDPHQTNTQPIGTNKPDMTDMRQEITSPITDTKPNMTDVNTHHGLTPPIMDNKQNMMNNMRRVPTPVVDSNKHNTNTLTIPPGPGVREDKNI